jgi:two-component system, chemotaxis family, chemotaxis protein CheY
MSGQARIWDGGAADLTTAAEAEQSAPPVPRVLVIDRDNLHRMIICRAADKAGYIPAGAANLAEATKLVQSAAFDCITLDLSFGRGAASDFLSRLDAIACKSKIFVIGGRDTAESRETLRVARSLGLDVEDPVAKPIDVEMLRYALEQLRIQGALQCGLALVGA